MATIELTEKKARSEWGPDWKLAVAFFGVVVSLYLAIGYAIYLAVV